MKSVCVCSKCSLKFVSLCCVWCTMTCFESRSAWLMFCYFLPFVVFALIFDCSSSHLCLFISSDKTVKIWLSKVWRKRWEPAGRRFLCQPFFHNLSHWSVTCSLLPQKCDTEITVSKAIGVSFFVLLCHKATRQSRGEICSQKKKSLPFRLFFTANLKVPFKCGATWKR